MNSDILFPGSLSRRRFFAATAGALGTAVGLPSLGDAADPTPAIDKKKHEEAVEKGLDWLKKTQNADGHWDANGGAYPVAMTALAGMALLMEGSNLKEGKYSEQIAKAVDWFLKKSQQPTGLLGFNQGGDFGSYMHGHGFATMFLACAYGEAEDKEQQQKLEKAVKKAADFCSKAQINRKHALPEGKSVDIGGWGYTSATENGGGDEGSITVTQLQALRAARNAGIAVSKETMDKALAFLEACTTPNGGLIYSYANGRAMNGSERPPITAAAVACSFSAGQYKGDLCKKWIKFCKEKIPFAKGRVAHDEYQSYYFAQFMYVLGDDRYGQMFPQEDKSTWMTWTKYKEAMYPYLIEQQDKTSGAWNSGHISPVFTSAVNLTILQLERGVLPIYQR
ncbi:MAG: terpene cyclase/mutase family protein [Planctomycetes bacterium]|nr:terpene cyclase/mutase family protein [Planctomycetota bacterium]